MLITVYIKIQMMSTRPHKQGIEAHIFTLQCQHTPLMQIKLALCLKTVVLLPDCTKEVARCEEGEKIFLPSLSQLFDILG